VSGLEPLLAELGARPAAGRVAIEGRERVFDCRYPLGGLAAAVAGALGLAVSDLWELRGGRPQHARVSLRQAAASLVSFVFLRVPGREGLRDFSATTALHPCRDERWIHLHGGLPHLHEGTLRVLGCGDSREAVGAAVARWRAEELEDALAAERLCGAMVRSDAEWARHPQGAALVAAPLVEILPIAPSAPVPLPAAPRPLSGVRALDLTRILAGPTCGRTLAEHGAEVLRIGCPRLPDIDPFVIDTGHGKRAADLDLDRAEDAAALRQLAGGADVFVNGYRGGSLARRGFGPEELAALRPGLVYVSIDCYGHDGPWRERPGWEQLAQSVTGLAHDHGGAESPKLLPAAACDYLTGGLAAWGALAALARRAREGGSWHVRVSLARTGMWLRRQRFADGAEVPPVAGFRPDEIAAWSATTETPYGPVTHLTPALDLSETAPRWELPTAPLGTHPPRWAP
jgi:crotonobetainyl-CoA:carnitine CoA-transferase CaiB-like acyl-CoA transferase